MAVQMINLGSGVYIKVLDSQKVIDEHTSIISERDKLKVELATLLNSKPREVK